MECPKCSSDEVVEIVKYTDYKPNMASYSCAVCDFKWQDANNQES